MHLTIQRPDYSSPEWEALTIEVRAEVRAWLDALCVVSKPDLTRKLQRVGEAMGAGYSTARRKYDALTKAGGDWRVLIDSRKTCATSVRIDGTASPLFRAYLVKLVESYQRNNAPAFRELKRRWMQRETIAGYETFPGWPSMPTGWHKRNLARIVKAETSKARLISIRIGTSSKTNTYLPIVHTTRVGLHHGAVIQFDDQWHDNFVTLGRKREAVRVIELGALDLLTGHRFHWGAKPRRRTASGGFENIRKRDMILFAAGMLHRWGYPADGSMWMVEHGTAAVSEDTAKLLYDATHGLIRIERQPIEGKQAALSGFWSGTEGGNFRAKACLESTHNLIRNDMAAISLQSGSHSSGLKGPVTTARQLAYIEKVVADVFKKVPQREHLLRLPAWDFHTQLIPWLTDYYQFGLACRTDHDLEGWERLGHVINEYTTAPGSNSWLSEPEFLALPQESQMIIASAVKASPSQWTRRRNLSPLEAWDRRPGFRPAPNSLICEMIAGEMVREITVRNGFIEFEDQELSPDGLIYKAKFITGPRARQEIPSGEKVSFVVNPFDDSTAFIVDARNNCLGEVPLCKRILPIDPSAFQTQAPYEQRPDIRSADLTRAAGEKHARIAEILEPTRINHREEVREARELREHNRRVLDGEPITPDEIHQARVTAGQKAARTAAANRLQTHGEARDWDAPSEGSPYHTADPWVDPFASLPETNNFPDSI
jgi:hypothetical protein